MKKIILFFIISLICIPGAAQHLATVHCHAANTMAEQNHGGTLRTTAVGDTSLLSNIAAADTLELFSYGHDSGFVFGTNAYGDIGFAERYDFNGTDSAISVLGVMAQFGGKVNPLSTNSINLMIWDITAPVAVTGTLGYSGFPQNGYDTISVPFTELGIGANTDTLKSYLFPEVYSQSYPFFIGYTLHYNFTTLNGDTIGLASSKNGARTSAAQNTYINILSEPVADTTYDTLVNVQNAVQWSDNLWHDSYTQNDSLFNNLALFPIVAINSPSGVSNISRSGLSLFGNYPNPADNSTNIKLSLAKNAQVSVQIADMSGKILRVAFDGPLSPGDHLIPVATGQLASGTYLYIIHSSAGGAIAGKMTVAH